MDKKEELGDFFREKREKKNITLEKVSKETRLAKTILLAIETGSFEDLPGGFFNIGIIKAYAKYLGLDEKMIVNRYKEISKKDKGKNEIKEDTYKVKSVNKINLNKKKIFFYLFLSFAILFIIWLVIPGGKISYKEVVTNYVSSPKISKNMELSAKVSKNKPQVEVVNEKTDILNKKDNFKQTQISKKKDEKFNTKKTLKIDFVFTGVCWVGIMKKETTIVSKLFNEGEIFSVSGDFFNIRIGDPASVEVYINDEKANFKSKAGKPISLKVNKENFEQFME